MPQIHNVRLGRFAEEVRGMNPEDFALRFGNPFSVVERPETYLDSNEYTTLSPDEQEADRTTELGSQVEILKGVPFVCSIEKSGRNSFKNMITIGRSQNNDIVIPHLAVSKLHGVMRPDKEKGGYTFTDVGSTNGTSIGGMKLVPNQPTFLRSKEVVIIGGAVRTTYFSPKDLFEHLSSAAKPGRK